MYNHSKGQIFYKKMYGNLILFYNCVLTVTFKTAICMCKYYNKLQIN